MSRDFMRQKADNTVRDEGDLHRYRTEVPNIVFRLGLTPFELALYCLLKQTAGDKGVSWKSTATLAKETGMSSGMVSKAKLGLEQTREALGGKSLIAVSEQSNIGGGRPRHYIILTDIWPENMAGCSKPADAPDPQTTQVHVVNEPESKFTTRTSSSPHELEVHHMNFTSSPHELNKELLEQRTQEEELLKENTESVRGPGAKTETVTATEQREDAPGVSDKSSRQNETGAKPPAPYPDDLMAFWKAFPAEGRTRSSLRETEAVWKRMTAADRAEARAGLDRALQVQQFLSYTPGPARWLRDRRWEAFTDDLLAEIAASVPPLHGDKSAAGAGVYSREIADALGSVAGEDGWEPERPAARPAAMLADYAHSLPLGNDPARTDLRHTDRQFCTQKGQEND